MERSLHLPTLSSTLPGRVVPADLSLQLREVSSEKRADQTDQNQRGRPPICYSFSLSQWLPHDYYDRSPANPNEYEESLQYTIHQLLKAPNNHPDYWPVGSVHLCQ